MIENIAWNGKVLASIIRSEFTCEKTTFVTPSDLNLQVGFVVYPEKGEISRHVHLPLERRIRGTSEVILVKKGRCHADIYNEACELVASPELRAGMNQSQAGSVTV